MTTINLHLPDDLAAKVQRLSGNAEKYIIGLLRAKVAELDETNALANEYCMAAAENAVIMQDFTHTDMEGWDDEY